MPDVFDAVGIYGCAGVNAAMRLDRRPGLNFRFGRAADRGGAELPRVTLGREKTGEFGVAELEKLLAVRLGRGQWGPSQHL